MLSLPSGLGFSQGFSVTGAQEYLSSPLLYFKFYILYFFNLNPICCGRLLIMTHDAKQRPRWRAFVLRFSKLEFLFFFWGSSTQSVHFIELCAHMLPCTKVLKLLGYVFAFYESPLMYGCGDCITLPNNVQLVSFGLNFSLRIVFAVPYIVSNHFLL